MSHSNNREDHNNIEIYNQNISKFQNYYNTITNDFMEKIIYSLNHFVEISSEKNIFISFNGGKDCLSCYILLKYYFYCQANNIDYSSKESYIQFTQNHKQFVVKDKNIFLIYFINENNFELEEDYVINFAKEEGVKIIYLYADYINGMKFLLQKFQLNMIIMGTRKDDVKSYSEGDEASLLFPSTTPYPEFMRFLSVFNWCYEDIWRLIISSKTSYIKLYDQGYSSIGRRTNSKINKNLVFAEDLIYPAWCLDDKISERIFRL
jgi:3'-phosphoadenosine 5'-phosphosulfate sulfotransferase (PAPS reductase)/FAD synthetase